LSSLYSQGDIIEVDFDPTLGHEPAKRRSALVVSVDFFNNVVSDLTVICPITSTASRHPLHVELPENGVLRGFICIEQIRAVDLTKRNCTQLGERLDKETMTTVLEAIGGIFGI
jgi:mRNA interferase MazF